MHRLMVFLAIVLGLVWMGPAAAERVALVIGNAAYQHTPRLINPRNDAADIGAALKQRGFKVIDGFDLDKAAFERKIREFAAALQSASVGLFFYAGHGLQVDGQNYLVPVDAQLTTASALEFEMVRFDVVHRIMEREAKTNILFLDACLDNPLARNLARALGTRSAAIGRGLAPVESGLGTLISFSTQPGNVALDGSGRNSPFAGALVKHMSASDDDLNGMLIAVRNDVRRETQNKQVPWERSALTGRFYFNPAKEARAPPAQPQPGPVDPQAKPNGAPRAPGRAPVHECDRLAAQPYDRDAVVAGVRADRMHAPRALAACEQAVRSHPDERRFAFQLARAYDAAGQFDKAKEQYEALADQGYGAAMNALAFWHNNGRAVKKDHAEGVFWLRRAVEAGNPDAMYWLARAYQSDGHLGVWPPDRAEAARLYRKAADAGHTIALIGLALMQDHGQGGFKPDAKAASQLMFQALQAGDEDAYAQMLNFGGSWFTQGFRREMQLRLKDAGLYDGPSDGNFGPPTNTAFQALKQRGR